MKFKIRRSTGVQLMQALGFSNADNYTDTRLASRLSDLEELTTNQQRDELASTERGLYKVMAAVLKAVGEGVPLHVVGLPKQPVRETPRIAQEASERPQPVVAPPRPPEAPERKNVEPPTPPKPKGVKSVIAEALASASRESPLTRNQIRDLLKATYPMRRPESIMSVVNDAVPDGLRRAGHDVRRVGKGFWIAKRAK